MADPGPCLHHQFSHCKFCLQCYKQHTKVTCKNIPCTIEKCPMRHPKPCRYFLFSAYCKFGDNCSFLHQAKNNKKIDDLENEVAKLRNDIEHLTKQLTEMNLTLTKLSKESTTPEMPCQKRIKPVSNSKLSVMEVIPARSYHQMDYIPQMDGSQFLNQVDHALVSNECENCGKTFESEGKLQEHIERYEFGCDECQICYTTKFHVDLHELEKHADSTYARDHVPYTTKLQFAAGCRVPTCV